MASDKKIFYEPNYINSWALIIGINKYTHASPLGYAINDAKAIANILEKKFGFSKDNITLLTDEHATIEEIKKSFLKYTNKGKIKPDDRLLVFYAGHGHTIGGKRGEVGFLVPVDGNPDDINSLIRWDELTRNADLIPAKHIFFLMDACYGGLAFLRRPSFGNMRFLGDMLKRYSRQVLTAGKADETVSDGNGARPGHSIFTSHLLDALDGSASTKDGVITASGVMSYVYDHVAKDQYSSQTPHYGFVDGDGDFIFDTSLLAGKKSSLGEAQNKKDEEKGDEDILINTSGQISTQFEPKMPIADAMKKLLSESSKKIELDDFISKHIRMFLGATDLRNFPVQGVDPQKDNFIERLNMYEKLSKDLQQIVILLAKWGNDEQLLQLEKIFIHLAESDKGSSGKVVWLHLTWYPIQFLMYSSGIAALSAKNYTALRIILETQVKIESTSDSQSTLATVVGNNLSSIHDKFKWLPGHEKYYVPRSEYLFTTLQPTLEDILFLGRSYEYLFDYIEILLALVYAHSSKRGWGPPGRFGWKYHKGFIDSPYKALIEEANKKRGQWGPIKAGLFDGSITTFQECADKYKIRLDELSWW
jgi:hypothetical protein